MINTHIVKEYEHVGEKVIDWCVDNFGLSKYHEYDPWLDFDDDDLNIMGEYNIDENTITIYTNEIKNVDDLIETIIHEYVHYLQRPSWYTRYINMGYKDENNPYEMIAETIAINNWKQCKRETLNETAN